MAVALKDLSGSSLGAEPVVSVAITSYNSEKWLGQAIESVLKQQADFPVEIVIADDCSKDATVAIAKSYQERYADKVRVLERAQNAGTQRNYYDAFEQCRGKYIAWLDADDYWTDPAKLAIQVAALEADPSIMVCCHYVRWVIRGKDGEVTRERFPTLPPGRHGMASILHSNFLPSPSVVFRNGLHRQLPEWYFEVPPLTDWPLYVVAARSGDILLIDRVMADYTLNPTSAFWGEGDVFWQRMNVEFFSRVESIIPAEFFREVRAEKGRRYEAIAYALRKKGDFVGSRKAAVEAFRSPGISDNLRSKTETLLASFVREMQWRFGGHRDATNREMPL
jgi:glycosyltransferase involved in cell wall biosynthesis